MSISFIIPVYNAEFYIVSCVESIINLCLPDFEIIIVDDGSKDNTVCEIEKALFKWNCTIHRVNLIKQENAGVSAARNHALKYCTKEWVTFVDADDLILPSFKDACNIIINYTGDVDVFIFDLFSSSNRDFSTFRVDNISQKVEVFDENNRVLLMQNTIGFVSNKNKLSYRFPNSPAKIYNLKRIIDKYDIRFPVGVKNGEDLLFNLQVMEKVNKVVACHIPVYLYYSNTNSLTHRFKSDIKEITLKFFDNLWPFVERHQELIPQYHKSKVNNFYLEAGHFLFHPQNKMKTIERWDYFQEMLKGYYHESFLYLYSYPFHNKFNFWVFTLIKMRLYKVAFAFYMMKYFLKCMICRAK